MKKRIIQIIQLLKNHDKPLKSEEIAFKLNINARSVRNALFDYKEELKKHGIHIINQHKVGYVLHIEDLGKAEIFLDEEESESDDQYNVQYIIRRLLLTQDYVKLDDLAQEMFLSRSTINRLYQTVKEQFNQYQIQIESKPFKGVKIVGTEMNIRSCMSKYIFNRSIDKSDVSNRYQCVKKLVIDIIQKYQFAITDFGIKNLTIHLLITMNRIVNNQFNLAFQEKIEGLENTVELEIANEIICDLQEMYHIEFPEIEQYYIAIHLASKKNSLFDQTIHFTIEEERLIQQTFKKIKENLNVDFSKDLELKTCLLLHLKPMLVRINYGLKIENPLFDKIKQEMILAFEAAVITAQVIQEQMHKNIDEFEISYLALHYSIALKKASQTNMQKILVVCASGFGTSRLLGNRISEQYNIPMDNIEFSQSFQLEHMNLQQYSYIFTTVPIAFETKVPIIYIENIFDDFTSSSSAQTPEVHVQKYLPKCLFFDELACHCSEDVIQFMCEEVQKLETGLVNMKDSVLQREQIASTEIGGQVAFPHPLTPCSEQTYLAFAILKKPIRWKKQMVRFVAFLSISKHGKMEDNDFVNQVALIISNEEKMMQLLKNPSYEFFLYLFNEQ